MTARDRSSFSRPTPLGSPRQEQYVQHSSNKAIHIYITKGKLAPLYPDDI